MMYMINYNVADFRKKIKEALDTAESGTAVYIRRGNSIFQLRLTPYTREPVVELPDHPNGAKYVLGVDPAFPEKKSEAQAPVISEDKMNEPVEFAVENMAEWDLPMLKGQLMMARAELNRIDDETQDPDEIARGERYVERISKIEAEIARRGA